MKALATKYRPIGSAGLIVILLGLVTVAVQFCGVFVGTETESEPIGVIE